MTKEEFMNLEADKTFTLGRKKFKVVETGNSTLCNGCYFDEENYSYECLGLDMQDKEIIPFCCSLQRKNKKNVIFVEMEK